MSKEYRIPKNIKPQDLVRGIINASFWHWNTIDKTQHTEAITYLNNLESIDNANPSEALKWLEHTGEQWVEYGLNDDVVQYKETQSYREINQALIKAQEQEEDIIHYKGTIDNLKRDNALLKEIKKEQEQVLKIIKEKYVDIYLLKSINTLEEYNKNIGLRGIELTQEEYDLLKKWLG